MASNTFDINLIIIRKWSYSKWKTRSSAEFSKGHQTHVCWPWYHSIC